MAHIENWVCSRCLKSYQSAAPRDRVCHICRGIEREQYLMDLVKLSIEQRLRRIEETLYDQNNERTYRGDY